MMILSSGLASLGLLEGSTVVVIGAMLVAPLTLPLIGSGMALAQGIRGTGVNSPLSGWVRGAFLALIMVTLVLLLPLSGD